MDHGNGRKVTFVYSLMFDIKHIGLTDLQRRDLKLFSFTGDSLFFNFYFV